MKAPVKLLVSISGLALLSACATPLQMAPSSPDNPPMIGAPTDNLRIGAPPPATAKAVDIEISNPKAAGHKITKIRSDGLKEAAQTYGSQMGYARRSWEIAGRLQAHSSDLSSVFDFNRLVSAAPAKAGVIVPPVVSRSFDAFLSQDDGKKASVADEYLTIVSPGRIAPTAPTWRDFLIFSAPTPEKPAESLMPSDPAELKLFEGWFQEGWDAGEKLADAELDERLNRLERDYKGMLQYRRLVAKGMMNRMVIADADFGTTEKDNEMRIGSRTVQIVSDAQFQSDPMKWKVSSVSQRDALIVSTGEIPPASDANQ